MEIIQLPGWMIKLLLAIGSAILAAVVWISRTAWRVAEGMKDLENSHVNHVVDDTRRFELIGEKLDDYKDSFSKLSDSHNEISSCLKSLVAAGQVQEKMINQRFDDIQSQLREIRKL